EGWETAAVERAQVEPARVVRTRQPDREARAMSSMLVQPVPAPRALLTIASDPSWRARTSHAFGACLLPMRASVRQAAPWRVLLRDAPSPAVPLRPVRPRAPPPG